MRKKSDFMSKVGMYGLRIFNAVWRGGDYSFILLNMIFGLWLFSLIGLPLMITGVLLALFFMGVHLYKAINDEDSEQSKLKKSKIAFDGINLEAKNLIAKNINSQKQLHQITWIFIKQAWNRIREFVSAFNDGVKLIVSFAIIFGLTLCSMTPLFQTIGPLLASIVLVASAVYGVASFSEYHLKRARKRKIQILNNYIRRNREIELGIYNSDEKKYHYTPTTSENIYNTLRLILCMIPSFFAGTFFGLSVLSLVFGYIFKPLSIIIPGLPIVTEIVIPVTSAILFGCVFMVKNIRDELKGQKDEKDALRQYYQRLNLLKKLYGGVIPYEIERKINPKPVKNENITFQMAAEKTWVFIKKAGNRLMDSVKGTRNLSRFIQFILSITFVSVSFGVCGVSTGILGAFGAGVLIPIVAVGLVVGTTSFLLYALQSRRRDRVAKIQSKRQIVENEIKNWQNANRNRIETTPVDGYKDLVSQKITAPRGEIISGYAFRLFERASNFSEDEQQTALQNCVINTNK